MNDQDMTENDVRCDKCGYTVPIPLRHGTTCNQGLQGGGYCTGTMLRSEKFPLPASPVYPPSTSAALKAKLSIGPGASIQELSESRPADVAQLVSLCRVIGRRHWNEIAAANPDVADRMAGIARLAAEGFVNDRAWRDLELGLGDDPNGVVR